MDLDRQAMECAVEMELQAAIFTTTRAKADVIRTFLEVAYQAGAKSVRKPPQEPR